MSTKMLINAVESEELRVAIVKDGLLDGFYVETTTAEDKIGNIYKGVVDGIRPSLQACFVDYGNERNGFLPASDVHPEYYVCKSEGDKAHKDHGLPPIEKMLKKGQELLVQITKQMPGKKGASLTTYLSLASRYVVLTPGRPGGGISKKIEDEEERHRLKSIMNQFKLPEGIGYILRTASYQQSKRELSKDLNRLLRVWKDIRKRVNSAPPLSLIHQEQDVCLRTLRDYFTGDVEEVLVDDKETLSRVKAYMKIISPRHQRMVKLYKEKRPIFDLYNVEKQIETIYGSRVPLKSGGSIVIDPTEALISIDVNSGRTRSGSDVEATVYKTNLEAAREIARQLRLRDMGGLVVIDFIDMKERKHIREVEKALREEAKKDRAKIDLSHISKFGLLELSRQRLRPSIESKSYQTCSYCQGRGLTLSVEAASASFMRRIWMGASKGGVKEVRAILPLEVATYIQNRKRRDLTDIEARYRVFITLQGVPGMPLSEASLEFVKNDGDKKK